MKIESFLSFLTVSKTVEELILDWKQENPITTGSLQMTQFAMVDIVAAKCHEAFQIGKMHVFSHFLLPTYSFAYIHAIFCFSQIL